MSLQNWYTRLQATLDEKQAASLYRRLNAVGTANQPVITIKGREYLQFSSNNYLGLADHPAVVQAAKGALDRYGLGAGASRLVTGSIELHHQLESALAAFKGTSAALVFPTGFMANLAVLTTFANSHDLIVSDKLNHASLLDAAAASGAYHRTFLHRHYERAKTLLSRTSGEELPSSPMTNRFLVTDTVFSMDGDLADLQACCDIADAADSLVILDEAHATGVLGPTGGGVAELQNVTSRIAVTVGTLSKALGSIGGFVCGDRAVIETLINAGRSFIYTTALPPACSAGALAALKIIQEEPQRRHRLQKMAAYIRTELIHMGFEIPPLASHDVPTPIIPILIGSSEKAIVLSEKLKDHGLWIPAIRPPTVPPNTARLRLSLMATHTDAQIAMLLETFKTL